MLLNSNGCSKEDYVLSANLPSFVMELSETNPLWYKLDLSVQREDVRKMAAVKTLEINRGIVALMPQGV